MGGVQTGTILLAEALSRRGHDVIIFNDRDEPLVANGVKYNPVTKAFSITNDSIVVSNNSLSIFDLAPKARKVVWARNNIVLNRIRREKALSHLMKYRPNIVFPSHYSARKTPWYFPFRSRTVILHGVDTSFALTNQLLTTPDPIAIFASQPIRNLKRVVKAWNLIIHPALPQAKLYIYYPKPHLYPKQLEGMEGIGIEIKGSVPKSELAKAFSQARVMIYPGHRTETFCNVAAEALSAGLPIATMGIGALKERVRHKVDGLKSWSTLQMGRNALKIMTDDALWINLHKNALQGSKDQSWDVRAKEWEVAAETWS